MDESSEDENRQETKPHHDDNDGVEEEEEEEEEAMLLSPTTTANSHNEISKPLLSRSWSMRAAHVPIYTGGKLTQGHVTITSSSSSSSSKSSSTDVVDDNDDKEEEKKRNASMSSSTSCLLLPVGGDLALVDAATGVTLATVRGGTTAGETTTSTTIDDDNDGNYDDEEQGLLDADAITAYAWSSHQKVLVTCSHNSLLRQYAVNAQLSLPTTQSQQDNKHITSSASASVVPPIFKLVQTPWSSGHTLAVTAMEFHSSHVFLATGSMDGSVRIWDVRRRQGQGASAGAYGTHLFRPIHNGGGGGGLHSVTALVWLPDVTQLVVAIGRDDGSIVVHNLLDDNDNNNCVVAVLRDHVSAVTCIEWSLPHKLLITTGRDAVVNLWKMTTMTTTSSKSSSSKRKKRQEASAHHHPKTTTTSSYERIHTLPVYEQVEGMVVLPPNRARCQNNNPLVIATAGSKGRVRLWKASLSSANAKNTSLTLLAEQPASEAFGEERGGYMRLRYYISNNNNNNRAADGRDNDDNDSGKTSTTTSKQEQLIVADAEHNISFLSLSDDDDDKNKILTTKRTIVGHNDDILDLKVIPTTNDDGTASSRIVLATNSAQVRLFELEGDFSCSVLGRQHTATVLCVDVSPCGRYIATCGKDRHMRLWHVASRQCVAVAVGHTEAVGSTALSRKVGRYEVTGKAATNGGGAFVVTASMDRTIKRWNLPGAGVLDEAALSKEEIPLKTFASVRAHEKDINIVSIAPNDSLIATGSQDKTVKIWKATDLSLQATLKGHRRGVWDCQFSPFDRVLATASGDRTIKLWSLSDYSCVRTFQGHVASVLRVRFLSGGLQLVSSGADGLVKLWTIRNNECEATMDGHNDKVWALDLSPDGKTLVSGGADSQLVVWEDTTKEVEAKKQAEEEEAILMDQRLSNHLRHKEYSEALEIALERDKPQHVLKVLTAIIDAELEKGKSGLDALKQHARTWSNEQLVQVLRYCREWNTRSRNSHVAMLMIKGIVTTTSPQKLASIDGVPEILAGIVPYAERHFDRLDRLFASSYLLDFALFAMGGLDATDSEADFSAWESKLVLPPKTVDGRVQIGGNTLIGVGRRATLNAPDEDSADNDSVMTVGESDSSEEES